MDTSTTTTPGFLTRDPIGYEGSEWNLYQYLNSSPLYKMDPSGLKWTWGAVPRSAACFDAAISAHDWCTARRNFMCGTACLIAGVGGDNPPVKPPKGRCGTILNPGNVGNILACTICVARYQQACDDGLMCNNAYCAGTLTSVGRILCGGAVGSTF